GCPAVAQAESPERGIFPAQTREQHLDHSNSFAMTNESCCPSKSGLRNRISIPVQMLTVLLVAIGCGAAFNAALPLSSRLNSPNPTHRDLLRIGFLPSITRFCPAAHLDRLHKCFRTGRWAGRVQSIRAHTCACQMKSRIKLNWHTLIRWVFALVLATSGFSTLL